MTTVTILIDCKHLANTPVSAFSSLSLWYQYSVRSMRLLLCNLVSFLDASKRTQLQLLSDKMILDLVLSSYCSWFCWCSTAFFFCFSWYDGPARRIHQDCSFEGLLPIWRCIFPCFSFPALPGWFSKIKDMLGNVLALLQEGKNCDLCWYR